MTDVETQMKAAETSSRPLQPFGRLSARGEDARHNKSRQVDKGYHDEREENALTGVLHTDPTPPKAWDTPGTSTLQRCELCNASLGLPTRGER
jgi:hypothetical protein